MSQDDATRIIAALQKRHKKFALVGYRIHEHGLSLSFKYFDVDPRTISHWFDAIGCYTLYIGCEGVKDNRVFTAEVRF